MSHDSVPGSCQVMFPIEQVQRLRAQMVGIWCVWMWQELGRPRQLRLVELGPGRGTLMADLLRSTAAFPDFARSVSVELVEVNAASPAIALMAESLALPGLSCGCLSA